MSEKLQKVLAHAGHGSRRAIEAMIQEGRVSVNGKQAKLGDRVISSDRILLDGNLVSTQSKSAQTKAILYHKPEGEIVSRNDPNGRPQVFDKLPAISNGRWVAVGRLDINTSGLLLFTNNGELANLLMHPKTGVEREYLARVRGQLNDKTIEKLTKDGIKLDGQLAKFDSVVAGDLGMEGSNHWYRVVIKEGRYREVRRLFEAVNHPVSRLKRIRYGTIKLTRDLKLGHSAKMAPQQLEKLINAYQLDEHVPFNTRSYVARGSTSARSSKRAPGHKQAKQRMNRNADESEKTTSARRSGPRKAPTDMRRTSSVKKKRSTKRS